MALLQECPKCKGRFSISRKLCRCGFNFAKKGGKIYWVSVYVDGEKVRERIGPNKQAAEQRAREILNQRAEGKYIHRDPATRITLKELATWYLELSEVKAKDSYRRDKELITHLRRLLGEETKIKDITVGRLESYQTQRLQEPSPRHPGKNVQPATVNKEVSCLKTILNRGVKHGKLKNNPVSSVKKIPENNIRERILTEEEFNNLLNACATHIKPIVSMAYHMGMRYSKIILLTWSEVDLKKGFIRLSAERTKTNAERKVPIHPEVRTILEKLPRGLHTDRVFLIDGKPFTEMKRSFKNACEKTGIKNFTFHDLRHCAINNLRQAGNDYFRIMAMSGHKTMSVFKRYNLVTEEELSQIKWPEKAEKTSHVGTYVGTYDEKGVATASQPLDLIGSGG